MRISRMLNLGFRRSLMALLGLGIVLAITDCSKKDVKEDEPAISAGSEGTPATPEGTVGAGEAGQAAAELETVYFAYDSYKLSSESREQLKRSAEWMKANASASVQVEGHCDERGTTEYNLALGERRANAAKDYLVRLGVDPSRLSIISYGEERPVDPGHDEAAWSKNRRAAFVLLSK